MSKGRKLWLWVPFVLLVLFYATARGYSINDPHGMGYLVGTFIGALLVPALLVLVVAGIYWLIKRERMPGIMPKTLVVAIVILTLLSFQEIQDSANEQAPRGVVDSISEVVSGREERGIDDEGYAVVDDEQIDTERRYEGDWGLIEQFVRLANERERRLTNSYLQRLDAMGWDESFLDPERLYSDTNLEESLRILDEARTAVDTYVQQALAHNEWVLAEARRLEFSSARIQEDFFRGIENAQQGPLELHKRALDLELEVMASIGNVVQALKSSEDVWWVDGGEIYFEGDDDLNNYNQAIEEMNAVIQEQEHINVTLREEGRKKLEALRDLGE